MMPKGKPKHIIFPSLLSALACLSLLAVSARAGSLQPSASPAGTMRTLLEVSSKDSNNTFDRSTDSLEAIRDRADLLAPSSTALSTSAWTSPRAAFLDYLGSDLKYLYSNAASSPASGSVAARVSSAESYSSSLDSRFGAASGYSSSYPAGTSVFLALKDIRDILSSTLTLSGGLSAASVSATGAVSGASGSFDSLTVGGGYGSAGLTLTAEGNLWLDGDIYQSTGTVYYSDALHYTGDYSVSGTFRVGYDPDISDNSNYLAITAGGQVKHDQDLIMQVDYDDSPANQYFRVRNGAGTDILTLDELGNLALKDSGSNSLLSVDAANNRVGIGTATPEGKLSVAAGPSNSTTAIIDGGTTDKVPLVVRGSSNITKFSVANSNATGTTNITKFGFEQLTTEMSRSMFEFQGSWTDNTDATRTAQADLYVADAGVWDSRLTVKGSDVGIGTASPTSKLDVDGNINADSVLEARNAANFSGADIGAKINAAIADFGSYQGTVIIPPEAWEGATYSTQIVVNKAVHLVFPSRYSFATYTGTESAIKVTSGRAHITSFSIEMSGNGNSDVDGVLVYGASDLVMDGGINISNPVRHGIFIDGADSGAYNNNFYGTIRITNPTGGDNIHLGTTGSGYPNANHFYGMVLNGPPSGYAGIRTESGYSNSFNDVYVQSGAASSWAVYNSGSFNYIGNLTADSNMPGGIKVDAGDLYVSGLKNNAATPESVTGGTLSKGEFDGDMAMKSATFSQQITINATGSQLKIQETDAPDPNDYWLIESNAGQYNLYWRDNSLSTWKRPFSVEANTPDNAVYLDSTGYVGLGTTTPGSNLHLLGTSNTYAQIGSSGANTLDRGIRFDNQAGSPAGYISFVPNTIGTDSLMSFFVGGGASGDRKMVINDNGNVGIGSTSPEYKLHIQESDTTAYASSWGNLTPTHSMLELYNTTNASSNYFSGIYMRVGTNQAATGMINLVDPGGSSDYGGDFVFQLRDTVTPFYLRERMRITGSGNVGIGTASPATTLDVAGAIRTAAGQNFKVRYGTSSVAVNGAGPGGLGTQAVSFGYTFTSAPVVLITNTSSGNWLDAIIANATSISTAGFTLYLTNPQANTASGTYTYNWVAIGD